MTTSKYTYRAQARFQRKVALLTLMLLVVIYALFSQTLSSANADSNVRVTYQRITVAAGDSLWLVASQYCGKQSIQVCIEQIKQLNGLESTVLQTGQQLIVPVY